MCNSLFGMSSRVAFIRAKALRIRKEGCGAIAAAAGNCIPLNSIPYRHKCQCTTICRTLRVTVTRLVSANGNIWRHLNQSQDSIWQAVISSFPTAAARSPNWRSNPNFKTSLCQPTSARPSSTPSDGDFQEQSVVRCLWCLPTLFTWLFVCFV